MPVAHYENFPVASLLLPRALRRPVELIYGFARQADDFADEGDAGDAERLAKLENMRAQLRAIKQASLALDPSFAELSATIMAHALPVELFCDLLDAFSQDVVKKRYANFEEVMDYCRRSANPIGRLLLHLYRAATPGNLVCADAICSGLQLVNFWQDVAIDYGKGRVYLPQAEMVSFQVTETQIARGDCGGNWRALMEFQIERTRALLQSGAPLARALSGRVGLEIEMMVQGGLRILEKIRAARCDVFRKRPKLRAHDWPLMLLRAMQARTAIAAPSRSALS